MSAFLLSFGVILLSELGDESQAAIAIFVALAFVVFGAILVAEGLGVV